MADRSISVKLTADAEGFKSSMDSAAASTKKVSESAKSMGEATGKATSDISKVGQAAADSAERQKGAMATMADSARNNSQAWTTVGTSLIAAGAAVGAIGLNAIRVAADFDQAMSSVQAATHAPTDEMEKLRAAAIKAGADTAFSATEAAKGIEELAKAGVSTQDILGGGLSGALDLAAAGELGVGEAAETAATAMTQFHLIGRDIPHVADLLAAGAGKAQGSVHDMAYAFKQSGLVAAQMGVSVEEATGTLAAFASAGLIGQDAGTSFKTMLQRLQNPSKKAANAMEEVGLNVYDANGKFIGLTATAHQLWMGMHGLTQAQRDQAMTTIFGSDAIRAANVLYNQGASGIKSWTDQVNDAGYAAETARLKQNNLKGDLEKLGGSWETLMINMGSSSQGPLRKVVQTLENVVDWLGQLSPKALGAVEAFSLIGGAALTAAGGFFLFAPKILESIDAMRTIHTAAQNAGLTLKQLATQATFAGKAFRMISVAGLIAGLAEIGSRMKETGASVEEMTNRFQSGAAIINGATFEAGTFSLQEYQHALADVARPSTWSSIQQHVASFGDSIAALAGADSRSDLQKFKDDLTHAGEALAKMNTGDMTRGFKQLSQELTDGTEPAMMDLINSMPEFKAHLVAMANQAKLSADDSTLLKIALGQIDASAREATPATGTLSDAIKQADESSKGAAPSINEVTDAIKKFSDVIIGASNSAIGYQQAVADAAQSAKDHGQNLDITTEAGRKNQKALNDLASSALKLVDDMGKAGTSQEEMRAQMETARSQFIAAAEAMGMTGEEAAALADKYGLIPEKVTTDVEANTAPAKYDASQLVEEIDGSTGYVTIGGDPKKCQYTLEQTADTIDGTTGYIDINADNAQSMDVLNRTVGVVDNSDGTISILGDPAKARWEKDTVKAEVDQTTGTVTISGNDQASGTIRTIQYHRDQLKDKTITITVNTITNESTTGAVNGGGPRSLMYATGGAVEHHAAGHEVGFHGAVYGPGTETSDSILSWLSRGEHVITAAEVRAAGGQNAIYELRRLMKAGVVKRLLSAKGFASGGALDSAVIPAQPSANAGLDAKQLRKALSGMRVELSTDGRNSFDGHLRNVADGRILTYDRLTRR